MTTPRGSIDPLVTAQRVQALLNARQGADNLTDKRGVTLFDGAAQRDSAQELAGDRVRLIRAEDQTRPDHLGFGHVFIRCAHRIALSVVRWRGKDSTLSAWLWVASMGAAWPVLVWLGLEMGQ